MRNKLCTLILVAAAFLGAGELHAQGTGEIIRLDPGLDALIPATAHLEKVGEGFGFVEGPVWVHTSKPGYLLFSDIPANVIDKLAPDGKVTVFLAKSGFAGDDPGDAGYLYSNGHATVPLYGSNGITLDNEGRITYCQHCDRRSE